MKQLDRLTFLVHGFCWTCMDWGGPSPAPDDPLRPYLTREQRCAEGWRSRLAGFTETDGLVVIPAGQGGPAGEYYAAAAAALGERCFVLDCPDCQAPQFWADRNPDYGQELVSEIEAACVGQAMQWNKEELHTALHCRACCRRLASLLSERGCAFDPATVSTYAWGASFDGCVTKYALALRRLLGLGREVGIDFGLTVPDAPFLLGIPACDAIALDRDVRLFVFTDGVQTIGLYAFAAHSLADPPAWVRLAVAPDRVTVRSKQGIRLWPDPEAYSLPSAPLGYSEPPQVVVRYEDGALRVPLSAGYVYRLAKAPAYVHMPRGMAYAEARDILASATLAG